MSSDKLTALAEQRAGERVREACARVLDAVVKAHRDEFAETQKWMQEAFGDEPLEHTFCEDFGCSSLTDFAAQIRSLDLTALLADEGTDHG